MTLQQELFLWRRKIEVDSIYPFPTTAFYIYEDPNGKNSERIENNPFVNNLDYQHFIVKEKLLNGLIRVNFYNKPLESDFYLTELSVSQRGLIEMFLIGLFYVPYCWIKNRRNK